MRSLGQRGLGLGDSSVDVVVADVADVADGGVAIGGADSSFTGGAGAGAGGALVTACGGGGGLTGLASSLFDSATAASMVSKMGTSDADDDDGGVEVDAVNADGPGEAGGSLDEGDGGSGGGLEGCCEGCCEAEGEADTAVSISAGSGANLGVGICSSAVCGSGSSFGFDWGIIASLLSDDGGSIVIVVVVVVVIVVYLLLL